MRPIKEIRFNYPQFRFDSAYFNSSRNHFKSPPKNLRKTRYAGLFFNNPLWISHNFPWGIKGFFAEPIYSAFKAYQWHHNLLLFKSFPHILATSLKSVWFGFCCLDGERSELHLAGKIVWARERNCGGRNEWLTVVNLVAKNTFVVVSFKRCNSALKLSDQTIY